MIYVPKQAVEEVTPKIVLGFLESKGFNVAIHKQKIEGVYKFDLSAAICGFDCARKKPCINTSYQLYIDFIDSKMIEEKSSCSNYTNLLNSINEEFSFKEA